LFIVVGGVTSASRTVSSVSGAGLTWTAADKAVTTTNGYVEIWSAHCASGVSAQTITVTLSGAGLAGCIGAFKCSGIATSSPLDGSGASASNNASDNTWSTGNAVTTNADDLIVAVFHGDYATGQTNTPSGTVINELIDFSSAQDNVLVVQYVIVSATQAAIAGTGATTGGAVTDEEILAAYKADTGGGGSSTPHVQEVIAPNTAVMQSSLW
jgi:hypothetical protein